MEDSPEHDDTFFRGLIQDISVDGCIVEADLASPLPLEGVLGVVYALMLVAPSADPGWTRVVAHTGVDSPRVRVHFDHFSTSIRTQGGFVLCPRHQCRKYLSARVTSVSSSLVCIGGL